MIIVEDATGKQRLVAEGIPYRLEPGEVAPLKVVGSIVEQTKQELEKELGNGLGDLISGAIKSLKLDKLLGKTNCTPCERRRIILNMASKLGPKETAKQLLETFKDNGTSSSS